MSNHRKGPEKSMRTMAGLSLLAALGIALAACGAGGAPPASTTVGAVRPVAATAEAAAAPAAVAVAAAVPAPATPAPAPTPVPSKTVAVAPTAGPTGPKATTAPAPTVTAPAPTTPPLPARRQPTPAELNGVIGSVHALVPLFTPSPGQISQAGNQVCTAFDQGQSVTQVKATAMQMAGAYAALVPASVADSALRTIVTLFCPGYAAKLA